MHMQRSMKQTQQRKFQLKLKAEILENLKLNTHKLSISKDIKMIRNLISTSKICGHRKENLAPRKMKI